MRNYASERRRLVAELVDDRREEIFHWAVSLLLFGGAVAVLLLAMTPD